MKSPRVTATGSAPRRSVLLSCVVTAATLAGGCSFIPTYERPIAPVGDSFPTYAGAADALRSGLVGPVAASPAASVAWEDFFGDPRLKSLIAQALDSNRDLRVAVLNIELARAQYGIRRADQYPTVAAVGSGRRTPGTDGSTTSVYQAGLAVTAYEIDFFGRIASLKEAALNDYLATEEGRRTTQISLIAAVANAYLSILAADELQDITRQTLATRDESVRLSKLRFDNGVTSELDFRQAESLAEAARVAYAQLQRRRALDENALTLLVGRPVGAVLPAADMTPTPLASWQPMASVPAGLPSDLLTSRPDIRRAEQLLLAANANIGAARAAFFPNISLTVGAGSASSQLSGLFKSGSWGWTLAPQLVLPIFDAGRNQAGLGGARARRDIAVAQYEKAIQSAFREVADALAFRATLAEELRAIEAQANAEAVRFRLSDLRYRNGVSNYLDLLDAQRSLFAARQQVVQTRLAQLQNQVTLYQAIGGGWTSSGSAERQP